MHPKENTLKEEFKMTKFEIIGSEFQKEAASEREAMYRMKVSCDICSKRGIIIPGGCSSCAIKGTHAMVMEAFRFIREYESNKQAAASREDVNINKHIKIKLRRGY